MPGYLSALASGDEGEAADRREAAIGDMISFSITFHNNVAKNGKKELILYSQESESTQPYSVHVHIRTWRGRPQGGSRGSGPTGRGGRVLSCHYLKRRPCGRRGRCSTGRTPSTYIWEQFSVVIMYVYPASTVVLYLLQCQSPFLYVMSISHYPVNKML